jgi:hypothetical protein
MLTLSQVDNGDLRVENYVSVGFLHFFAHVQGLLVLSHDNRLALELLLSGQIRL